MVLVLVHKKLLQNQTEPNHGIPSQCCAVHVTCHPTALVGMCGSSEIVPKIHHTWLGFLRGGSMAILILVFQWILPSSQIFSLLFECQGNLLCWDSLLPPATHQGMMNLLEYSQRSLKVRYRAPTGWCWNGMETSERGWKLKLIGIRSYSLNDFERTYLSIVQFFGWMGGLDIAS